MTVLDFPEVSIVVSGETYVLKVTPETVLRTNKHFGSLSRAHQRVVEIDYQAILDLIALGAGLDADAVKALPSGLVRHGITEVVPSLSSYILLMLSGGRPPEASAGESQRGPTTLN